MGRRHRDQGAVRDAAPSVLHSHAGIDPGREARDPASPGDTLAAGCEAADPEQYGVRVDWQPEAVRIEAAEFLVATRTEHEKRLRASHDIEHRHHEHDAS